MVSILLQNSHFSSLFAKYFRTVPSTPLMSGTTSSSIIFSVFSQSLDISPSFRFFFFHFYCDQLEQQNQLKNFLFINNDQISSSDLAQMTCSNFELGILLFYFFYKTDSTLCIQHCNHLHSSQWIPLPTWLCLFLYSF